MGKKRKHAGEGSHQEQQQPAAAAAAGTSAAATEAAPFKNKEKVLILSTRGITFRWVRVRERPACMRGWGGWQCAHARMRACMHACKHAYTRAHARMQG